MPVTIGKIISKNLTRLREERFGVGRNKTKAAQLVGVSDGDWGDWESGKVSVSDENKERIAVAFGSDWLQHDALSP